VTGPDGIAVVPPSISGVVALWAAASDAGVARVPALRLGPDPVRVELARGGRVQLEFQSLGGDAIVPAEARHRLEGSGPVAVARVASESAVSAGSWSDPGSPLSAPCDAWQEDVPIEWNGTTAFLEGRLPAGLWRVAVPCPGA